MDFSRGEAPQTAEMVAALPKVWIGYLLSLASFIALAIHFYENPGIADGNPFTPPLYLFLPAFVTLVYWFVCVYRLHVVLKHAPGWKHPISPARAAGFHFIPIYCIYWLYKWPTEVAKFVDWRLQRDALSPVRAGLFVFFSYAACVLLGPGGLLLMFLSLSYLTEWVRRALLSPPRSFGEAVHSSE